MPAQTKAGRLIVWFLATMQHRIGHPRKPRERLNRLAHPILGFALGLLAVIWIAVWQQIETERAALERDMAQDAANLALVFEQNIARSVSEIDRVLLFLRHTYARSGGNSSWPDMIGERYTANEQTLQIAVIDASGKLVATSWGPQPPQPIDLSDREHFRVHLDRSEDQLFISKPVLGRASRRWSVQLTRRFLMPDGRIGGVIVVSLDPEHLSRTYGDLSLGEGGGLALVGNDDIIRAGAGSFAGDLGRSLTQDYLPEGTGVKQNGTELFEVKRDQARRVIASRAVRGYPLLVVVAGRDILRDKSWQRKLYTYLTGAGLLSVVVVASMLAALRSRRRHEFQVAYLARHDGLTGLSNRARFRDKLEKALAEIDGECRFALHVIDLDRFKGVNDTHGHPIGDQLLKGVADRLRANLRRGDLVARIGGDEFAIIQAEVDDCRHATSLADRICQALSRPFLIDGLRLEIGASVGIAMNMPRGCTVPQLLKAADLALYAAKAAGRGTWRVFNAEMSASARARNELEISLRNAISNGELELHYQPILSLTGGNITGYEALLRWRHPQRGMISPADFVPIAEETGLIIPIGAWVLETACREIARRTREHRIAVNFSPIQFRSPDLIAMIVQVLNATGLEPHRLVIEITESTLMQRDNLTIGLLRDLRALGVHLALDDFGTGYSSLSCLHAYPINCIKIDRAFVKTLGETDSAAAIVRAINSLAAALGMSTTAEGVETAAQLEELTRLGCSSAQGFHIGKPLPAASILPQLLPVGPTKVLAA